LAGRDGASHPDLQIHPLLRRPWIVETDPDQADFIIAT
jgi:hypothetical protein